MASALVMLVHYLASTVSGMLRPCCHQTAVSDEDGECHIFSHCSEKVVSAKLLMPFHGVVKGGGGERILHHPQTLFLHVYTGA